MKKILLIWIVAILLIVWGLYLIFFDPLERHFDLTRIVLGWVFIAQIADFTLRHNKIYRQVRNIAIPVLLIIIYFIHP